MGEVGTTQARRGRARGHGRGHGHHPRAAGGVVLLAMALLGPSLSGGDALAQTAAPASAAGDPAAQAASLYETGLKAANAKRWDEAYAAFAEAWRLKQHPQVAANLGRAALMTKRPREAAERLSYVLREAPDLAEGDRKQVEELLAEARKQVGAVTVSVSRPGATVLLDGVAIGKAPLAAEVFVDPGARVIEARVPGQPTARAEVDVRAGVSHHVGLWLVEVSAGGAGPRRDPEEAGSGRASWRGPLIGVGVGATVATAGLGAALALTAQDSAAARDRAEADGNREEHAQYEGARVRMSNAAFWTFVAAGALGVGTLGIVLLAPEASGEGGVRVEARGPGVTVRGAW